MSLVIIAARYYRDDTQEAVDVTEHIRGAASSNQLSLSGSDFNSVCGDPFPNVPKILEVSYVVKHGGYYTGCITEYFSEDDHCLVPTSLADVEDDCDYSYNPLNIVVARYVKDDNHYWEDVTAEITALASDRELTLSGAHNDYCGDPFPNFTKTLFIHYSVNGNDLEVCSLPEGQDGYLSADN